MRKENSQTETTSPFLPFSLVPIDLPKFRQLRGRAGDGGWPSTELGFPNRVAAPPPTEPKSKVLRLGARARKGLEMMSQKPGALLVPLPRGPGAGRGRAPWADGRTGQEEEGTRQPELRLSRLLRARRCNEPALPPPSLSEAGSGLRRLSLSASPRTFDPGRRLLLKLWLRSTPTVSDLCTCAKMTSSSGLEKSPGKLGDPVTPAGQLTSR